MSQTGVRLGIGTKFTYDGETAEIIEMHTIGATLEVIAKDLRTQTVRRLGIQELLNPRGVTLLSEPDVTGVADSPDAVSTVLSCLSREQRAALREKASHVREVLTGYRSGTEGWALQGEPRAEYSTELPLGRRYATKAREIGKSVRTIESWVKAYRNSGEMGLVSRRAVRSGLGCRVDPRWEEAALEVMVERTDMSRPTASLIVNHARARVIARYGEGVVPLPSRATAYRALQKLDAKHPTFRHSTKRNRDIAQRSSEVYGKLRPARPGEYMLMDTTRLDVFAMDPLTLRWVAVDLTVVMDWYTRCITGLRVTPMSTKSIDAAAVLYQTFRPMPAGRDWPSHAVWPPHGVPRSILIDKDVIDREGVPAAAPAIVPDSLIIDHGKIFIGDHLNSTCRRLGISIQPARVGIARDKGPVERFFRTLRDGLLQELPGYKGPDIHSRGVAPERDAFFFLDELESIIREWVAVVYHHRAHDGLFDPALPSLTLTPAQMYEHGVARAGYIEAPRDPDLAYEFLKTEWRTIQHHGVVIDNRIYRGEGLPAVGEPSPYRGKGKTWPFHVNPDDIARIYFRNEKTHEWQTLIWDQAPSLEYPYNEDTLAFARRLARAKYPHFDDRLALADLLERAKLGQGATMAERRSKLRLSREQSSLTADLTERNRISELSGVTKVTASQAQSSPAMVSEPAVNDDLDLPPAGYDDAFYADSLEDL